MLDIHAVSELLARHAPTQQSRWVQQISTARQIWHTLVADPALQAQACKKTMLVFEQPLNHIFFTDAVAKNYIVCGIDGSQIYPDRHEGFSEYLINIGTVIFTYGASSSALLQTRPFLFTGQGDEAMVTPELVNARRTGYELAQAAEVAQKNPGVCIMVDGALVFWHLTTPEMQELFVPEYLKNLKILQELKTPYIGYISASHSRELIRLIEATAELAGDKQALDFLVDTDILNHFLLPGQYTQLFKSNLSAALYTEGLEPYFFYLHTGDEIARVELPAYVARDQALFLNCLGIILDQNRKGNGYPICLSEAHEQAVVKAADRDFFYTLLQMHYQRPAGTSLKLMKKRSAAV